MNQTHYHRSGFKKLLGLSLALWGLSIADAVRASSSSEETAFLEIPVGGRPAALGGAYSALANDAYAPNLNPGGLGFLGSSQVSGEHLSYLEASHYEYLSFGMPLARQGGCSSDGKCPGTSIGGSVQYFGSGDIAGTDVDGNSTGDFSTRFAAYNLSVGRAVNKRLSFGLTGKWINARIAGVSAGTYALDVGSMYRLDKNVTLATVVTNLGRPLKFLQEGDPLPTALHLGAAFNNGGRWTATAEGVMRQRGDPSAHLGVEFQPMKMASLRLSYRTDAAREGGSLAGISAGIGVHVNGLDVSYAWMPLADLGVTHHISFGFRFDEHSKTRGARR